MAKGVHVRNPKDGHKMIVDPCDVDRVKSEGYIVEADPGKAEIKVTPPAKEPEKPDKGEGEK